MRVRGQGQVARASVASEIVAADLLEVGVLAVHPEHRHARPAEARARARGESGRGGDLVERIERAPERRRLLPGDRAHGFAAREPVEVRERGRGRAESHVQVAQFARERDRAARASRPRAARAPRRRSTAWRSGRAQASGPPATTSATSGSKSRSKGGSGRPATRARSGRARVVTGAGLRAIGRSRDGARERRSGGGASGRAC